MENLSQLVSNIGSSETLSDADLKSSFGGGENLDQQKSLVKQKEIELKEMQEQIESYNQMVKQLASQREMAVKKLADMDTQIQDLTTMLETERLQVEAKDKELRGKRTQLQALKNEEDELKEKFDLHKKELNVTTETLANTQLNEAQIKTKLSELQQFLSSTNAAIEDIERAINYKDTIKLSALCNQTLTPPPLSINNLLTNGMRPSSAASQSSVGHLSHSGQAANNFSAEANDPMFDSSANFDPFADDDPFDGDDPFKSDEPNLALPEDDPFNPSSSAASSAFTAVNDDPFAPRRDGF